MKPLLLLMLALLLSACASEEKDDTADWQAEQFYQQAKHNLDSGNFEQAISNFEVLEARFPFGPHTEKAQLDLAYAYYKFDEFVSAIDAADRFIKLHPRHERVDYAYYLKGMANFDTGKGLTDRFFPRDYAKINQSQLRESYQNFDTLVRKFPQSEYKPEAIEKMTFLRNKMAEHELLTARYYFNRSAFVATVNRVQHMLSNYEGTPALPEAIDLMAKAYEKLELPQKAQQSRELLNKGS